MKSLNTIARIVFSYLSCYTKIIFDLVREMKQMSKYPKCFPENFETEILPKGAKKEKSITCKMDFLIKMFVDLPYHVDIYYQHHFGIIGVDTTMKIDQIALC